MAIGIQDTWASGGGIGSATSPIGVAVSEETMVSGHPCNPLHGKCVPAAGAADSVLSALCGPGASNKASCSSSTAICGAVSSRGRGLSKAVGRVLPPLSL
ncbi:hypothetical protein BJV78DRAFT_615660 [Lactifluus subvellereus]|nr:hypothetical protein BJV78DRAFT_615660 [Lactifluus subvellereus]